MGLYLKLVKTFIINLNMRGLTISLAIIIGIIYISPFREITEIEGFWLLVGIVWVALMISRFLIGDIADEIAGVNKHKK